MKAILITLVAVMLQIEAPKNADAIIVKNSNTAADNFLAVKKMLASEDIEIASQDREVGQIVTAEIPMEPYGIAKFMFRCQDSTVVLTGRVRSGFETNAGLLRSTDDFVPLRNVGMKFSGTRKGFLKMGKFAQAIGGELTYRISR